MSTTQCPNCQQEVATGRFCANCAQPLVLNSPSPQQYPSSNQPQQKIGISTGVKLGIGGCIGVIVLCVGLVFVFGLLGSMSLRAPKEISSSGVTSNKQQIASVGQRVEVGGIALTVLNVSRRSQMGQFFKAADGKTYLLAEVLIETTGRDKAPYNPFYFKVKDSSGIEYTSAIIGDNALKSGELDQGDKVRGIVSFEVDKSAQGLVMSYEPLVILGGYGPIRVRLDESSQSTKPDGMFTAEDHAEFARLESLPEEEKLKRRLDAIKDVNEDAQKKKQGSVTLTGDNQSVTLFTLPSNLPEGYAEGFVPAYFRPIRNEPLLMRKMLAIGVKQMVVTDGRSKWVLDMKTGEVSKE